MPDLGKVVAGKCMGLVYPFRTLDNANGFWISNKRS